MRVERVAAAVLLTEMNVLLCHRSARRSRYPNLWGLPGGGVCEGETDEAGLVREVREELGVVIAVPTGPPLAVLSEPRPGSDHPLSMKVWLVTAWDGEPSNLAPNEHDAIAWLDVREAAAVDLWHPGLRTIFVDLARAAEPAAPLTWTECADGDLPTAQL
jgi:mutator protein MutT